VSHLWGALQHCHRKSSTEIVNQKFLSPNILPQKYLCLVRGAQSSTVTTTNYELNLIFIQCN
jgi:hypothetical protein